MVKKVASNPTKKTSTYGAGDILSFAGKVATNGLYLGLGASALLAENTSEFVKRAIQRGERVDITDNLYKFASMTKKQAESVRAILERKIKSSDSRLETRIKQEVANVANMVQIPLRKNLQNLNRRVTELSKQVNKTIGHSK